MTEPLREQARQVPIAPGNVGILQTLERMRLLVEQDRTSPFVVWAYRQATGEVPGLPIVAQVYEWVLKHLTYVHDGEASDSVLAMEEELRSPAYLINRIHQTGRAEGDCDDFVILLTSLLKHGSVRVRWIVTSARKDREFDHVFLQAFDGLTWVTLDGIHGAPMGWMVPTENMTNLQVVDV